MKTRRTLSASLATALFAGLPLMCHAESYSITDLGTLGGSSSFAVGVNQNPTVVGYSEVSTSGPYHAFSYSNGIMIDLGTLGGTSSSASAINPNGQIAGSSSISGDTATHAFSGWSNPGSMTDLGTLGGTNSFATAINNFGQVVGSSQYPGSGTDSHAFLYSGGAMNDIGSLGGPSQANGINDSGQIVGYSYFANSPILHAFSYTSGVMSDLGTLGGTNSNGQAVNSSGQMVGLSDVAGNTSTHAFIYNAGIMTDIDTLGNKFSVGNSINASGQVAGEFSTVGAAGPYRAFIYLNGGMHDLNSLIDPLSAWTLVRATSINDAGQIVGEGIIDGHTHAYLLNPVPEPSSIVLGSLALLTVSFLALRFQHRSQLGNLR